MRLRQCKNPYVPDLCASINELEDNSLLAHLFFSKPSPIRGMKYIEMDILTSKFKGSSLAMLEKGSGLVLSYVNVLQLLAFVAGLHVNKIVSFATSA